METNWFHTVDCVRAKGLFAILSEHFTISPPLPGPGDPSQNIKYPDLEQFFVVILGSSSKNLFYSILYTLLTSLSYVIK